MYKTHGITDLSYKIYKDDRHETLNELDREEVFSDVKLWLDKHR